MKRTLLLPLLLCSLLCMGQNRVSVTPATPMDNAVSGHYAAWQMGGLSTYGGCNFPDVPCADGGQKVYYPKAYGASVQVPGGAVYLGGMDATASLSDCTFLSATDGSSTPIASLPKPLDNFAATYHNGMLWVAGGQTNGVPNRDIYSLPYPGNATTWTLAATLPDECRLQPCVAVQNTATGYALFIFGGYQPKTESQEALVHTDGVYMPIAALKKGNATLWKRTAPAAVNVNEDDNDNENEGSHPEATHNPQLTTHNSYHAIVGSTCATSGYSHVLFFGGVDHDIFLSAISGQQDSLYLRHQPEWYRFRKDVLTYHTITDSWGLLPGDELLARAGACLTPEVGGKGWSYSGGELMPGVRSADVTHVEVTNDKSFGWLNWTILVLYLVGMLLMGFYFMRKEKGADDFFKGGGRIPWWAAGISIYATMLSAITYMTIPAKAYTTNWTYYPMLWMILLISFPVIKYYLPYFRKLNVTSAYEILEQRFNLFTRLLASTLFCIFMIVRMAIVLYLPSLALTAVTGIDIYLCIVLMGLVTIIYCTMGGVEAVIWGDVVQGLILVFGALFAVVYLAVNTEGGVMGCIDIALENDKLRLFDWSNSWSQACWWVIIIGGLANNLISYTSDQTVIQRYLTTPDEKSAGRGILVNGVMSVFVSVAFYMIGTGLYTFYKTHPTELDVTMGQSDAIFPFFMMSQMPAGIAGALIAAIFAATMSTISSNINSVATAFSIDFWKRFRRTTDSQLVVVARWASVVSGMIGLLLALLMATWDIQSFLDFFNEALGLLTSGLGGLFFIAVFMKRVKGYAALIGFVVGEAVVFWMSECTDANFFLFGATGMLVSIVVAWLLSIGTYFKKSQL
ncbi:MAG: sodium/solute symporter [Bacteroidaceae bacterium]|nr:sodium/solute symporter [Bacteroidaceae bacterium]